MDQKTFIGNGRERQYAVDGFAQLNATKIQRLIMRLGVFNFTVHLWRFAEQHRHRQIDRFVAQQ
jgi:hypothetical protein